MTGLVDKDWSQKLTPEEYALLTRRKKIGGVAKRDVVELREMCRRIDADGSGDISFDEFVTELESGASGMQHMRRTLEAMFRAADLDSNGSLSLWEFARVMLPAASPASLNEILAWMTYDGPALEAAASTKVYTPETVSQLRGLFDLYDTDGSGSIDANELRSALQEILASFSSGHGLDLDGTGPSQAELALARAREDAFLGSINVTGEISFPRFVELMGSMFEG